MPGPPTSTGSKYSRAQAIRSSRRPQTVIPRYSNVSPSIFCPWTRSSVHTSSAAMAQRRTSTLRSGTREHQGPVLAHLVAPAETGLGMERLLAPVVLMEAVHHGVDVVIVRSVDEPIDRR